MYSGSNPEGTDSPIKLKPAGLGALKNNMINRIHWVSTSSITHIGAHVSIYELLCRRHTARDSLPQEMFHLTRGIYLPHNATFILFKVN